MLFEQCHIFVRQLLAEHFLNAVGQHTAIQPDIVRLGQLADEGSDILPLHIGIRVILAACSRIAGVAVVHQEIQLVHRLAVFGMTIAIDHIVFSHLIIPLCHQCHLYLVLYLLHTDSVMNTQARNNCRHSLFGCKSARSNKRLVDGVFDFVDRENLRFSIALDDTCLHIVYFVFSVSVQTAEHFPNQGINVLFFYSAKVSLSYAYPMRILLSFNDTFYGVKCSIFNECSDEKTATYALR